MRRLLALLIVFVMASAASAAYMDIAVNGTPWTGELIQYSDIVEFKLIDDRGSGFMTGTISSPSFINVSLGDSYSHTWYAPPMGDWSFTPAGDGYDSSGTAMWIGGMLPANGVIFTHEFHVPYIEWGTVITVDYSILYSINTVADQVEFIPEPATIGLLAFGAFSLLRRRRK